MIDEKTVELYKKRLFNCHSCSHVEELIETLASALRVVRACQTLFKTDGTRWKHRWEELRESLKPFSGEK